MTSPKSNAPFWAKKFEGNVRRDRLALAALRKAGWRTLVVWECAFKHSPDLKLLRSTETKPSTNTADTNRLGTIASDSKTPAASATTGVAPSAGVARRCPEEVGRVFNHKPRCAT
jgi:G:T-mismatch repair DNA endonuclease (very short patch repair protein)